MSVNILALDVANNCGFAYYDKNTKKKTAGSWGLKTKRDDSRGMRLLRFKAHLQEYKEKGLELIVFEAARHAGPNMQGALVNQAELQGVLKLWCEENNIEYAGYSPSQIKKKATGKGNSKKELVIKAAQEHLSMKGKDGDEADARWLLELALESFDKVDNDVEPRTD